MIPKVIAECGEKKRRGFAADAREGEQNASDNSARRGLHHDVEDCFPACDAERESGFAITYRHKKNHFLGCPQDQWDHDQSQREASGVRGETFETQHDQSVNYHAPDDRWDAIEDVSNEA